MNKKLNEWPQKTQRKIQGIKITAQPFGVTKSNWD